MNTPEIEELKRLIEKQYGKRLSTTTDFEEFSYFMQRKTGAALSSSTLKRLYGYVGDCHKPRTTTLDTLAAYIGHKDYAAYVDWLKSSKRYNSSFFDANQLISSDLTEGDIVEIGWAPNRLLRLVYMGNSSYKVVEAHNSKLQLGDVFTTGCFIIGQPLIMPYIDRDGKRTGSFKAGRNGGLTIARKIES